MVGRSVGGLWGGGWMGCGEARLVAWLVGRWVGRLGWLVGGWEGGWVGCVEVRLVAWLLAGGKVGGWVVGRLGWLLGWWEGGWGG